jgi:hypothetical protein
VKIARACPYLRKTREWFKTKFGKHFNETIWEDLTFVDLIRNFIYLVGKNTMTIILVTVSANSMNFSSAKVKKEKQNRILNEGNVHEILIRRLNCVTICG